MNPTFKEVSSPYGKKLSIHFENYPGKEVVEAIKKLPWPTTHRVFNSFTQSWEIDLNDQSVRLFEEATGLQVPDDFKKKAFLVIPEGHTWFFAEGIDNTANEVLYRELSYRVEGAEFSEKYRRGEWDGHEHLYSKKWKGAPMGLVEKAEEILIDLGYKVEIIDKNLPKEKKVPYKWNFPYPLRKYQIDIIHHAYRKQRGIIALPTGAGKTIVGLRIIHDTQAKTIIVVHTKELLEQWKKKIKSVLGVEPGQIGDGKWEEKYITVAMLQSLAAGAARNHKASHYDLLIVDETHRIPADTWYQVAQDINAYWRFGLTATPWRNDGKDLKIEATVGRLVADVSLEPLVEAGFLAEPEFWILRHDSYAYGKDYNSVTEKYIIHNQERNTTIASAAVDLVRKGHKVLVDVKRVKHGRILRDLIREMGIEVEFLCGEDPSSYRQEVLKRFSNGLNCLVSTLVKEGVDIPSMTAVILAGGGKSSVMVIQTIGRALRPLDGKKAMIIDIEDRGTFVQDHYKARQEILKKYYGKFYEPGKVYIVGKHSVQKR